MGANRLPMEIAAKVPAAPFPSNYEKARNALAQCLAIDEVREVCIKSEALAMYAKQARDTTLETTAKRIRLRAFERIGELLLQFSSSEARKSEAKKSGLSDSQRSKALSVARCPKEIRETLIERNPQPAEIYEFARHSPTFKQRQYRPFPEPSSFDTFFRTITQFEAELLAWEKGGDHIDGITVDDCDAVLRCISYISEQLDAVASAVEKVKRGGSQ